MRKCRVNYLSVFVLLMILIISMAILFTGCNKEPVYEIKLYDDEWNELVKNDSGNGYKWDYYEFDYDGQPKGFNAKAFKDGKEFYKMTYHDLDFYKDNVINIFMEVPNSSIQIGPLEKDFPIESGEYLLRYQFYFQSFYDDPPYMFPDEPFPRTYNLRISFKIN